MAIQLDDTNTGVLTLKPGASGNYSLTFPAAVAAVNGYVLSSDTSGNLSWSAAGGSMVYPATGIANSTGSAWGTSYSTTGSGTVVALQTQPSFTTDIRTPKVTTASAVALVLDTNAGTTTGNITINTGANTAINIAPNGTGAVGLVASTVVQGVSNTNTTLTTNGTGNLILNTNSGTNAGSIVLFNGTNGNIQISPNGTGSTVVQSALTTTGNISGAGTLVISGTSTLANGSSNYFTLTGAASGTGPTVASAGATDANVNFNLQTKGTGSFVVASTTTNTTSNITASGANPNINLVLAGKGTGTVVANTFTISTAGAVTSGSWTATQIGVAYGGTGQTTYTDGQLLIGNTSGNTLTKATLTQGSGITITNGNGSISIANGSPMTYPTSGIANSTGSAWGTSYSTTGSGTVVALQTQPSFTTDIRTPKVTTASAVNLVLDTNAGTSTGNITVNTGINADIAVTPNGTGNVRLGDTTASGVITTGAINANLTLSTNNGTTSGTIVITAGTNGAISLAPNGTGSIALTSSTVVQGIASTATTLTTNGTANLTLSTNSGTNSGTILINNGVNGNIAITPNGTGALVVGNATTNAIITTTNASGADTAAPNLTIQGGANTGNNTSGGYIAFKTPTQGSSGSVVQTLTERMRLELSGAATQLDLTTTMTNANLFNTSATTMNFAGAATTTKIGSSGTVQLGQSASAITTVQIGGAITGNILQLNSGAGGTTTITTASTSNLVINTNSGTNAGSITLNNGVNGNISIVPNGTGTVILGDTTVSGTVTTGAAAANLTLNTNSGTNSGTIVITAGANNNISLTPNGVGVVNIGGTGAIKIPVGTDSQQPGQASQATAAQGMIRYNTTQTRFEGYNGTSWGQIGGGIPGGSNTQVQFNNSNVFAGSSNFVWNNTTNTLTITGTFNATTKSFFIDHPTRPGMKLVYGSLEGPEHGVYSRGRLTGSVIELPEHWLGLVDASTITVDLTPIGKHQKLYIEKIENNKVFVGNDNLFSSNVDCFYTVWATRKDVDRLEVEVNA